jgi:hypothetical protein
MSAKRGIPVVLVVFLRGIFNLTDIALYNKKIAYR